MNELDEILNAPRRRGASGRVPDKKKTAYQPYVNERYTCPPDLHARMVQFCNDEERAKSWVIQKALDAWLTERGY